MTSTEVFQRARSPEQKAQRRAAILDAAARLGAANGVRKVSLGDIAKSVGLTKSNVLRYFETREEVYLRLLLREARLKPDDIRYDKFS